LHGVHAEGADGVDGELFDAGFGFGDGHSYGRSRMIGDKIKPPSLAGQALGGKKLPAAR
jgi:hypothetical protein